MYELPTRAQQAPHLSTLSRRHVDGLWKPVDSKQVREETRVDAVSLLLRSRDPLHLGRMYDVNAGTELREQVVNPPGRASRFHRDLQPTAHEPLESNPAGVVGTT